MPCAMVQKFYAYINVSPNFKIVTKTLLSSADNVNIKALKAS